MGSDRVSIRLYALSVALSAKCGTLEQEDVDNMRTRAEELLHRDAPLYRAITAFATQHQVNRYDRAAMHDLGTTLAEAVRIDALPDVPDPDRRDING